MKRFDDKLVLVTGGGSGIGRETAIAFAKEGARVIVTDIREEGLRETKKRVEMVGGKCFTFLANVADAAAMRSLAATIEKEHGVVDVLVNNAGIGAAGRFLETTLETWRKVFDVNLMGVVHGCHAFLPSMVSRGRGGHVVNLASLAGYFAAADMPVYAASKFAVLGFSESLRADMAAHGIGVTAICPGIIDTGIIASTILEGDMGKPGVRDEVQKLYTKRRYTPAQVAEAIVDAVKKNQAVRPVSPESWAMYYTKRLSPGLAAFVARRQSKMFR